MPPRCCRSDCSRRAGWSAPRVGILGLFVTWRIGRRIGGPLAGLIALILLAACPLYYGHMFMNAKDAPFAIAMAVLLLGLVRAFDEYPQPTARTVALTGVGLGLAFGSRVLAGVAAPAALAALLFVIVAESRAGGWKPAAQRCGQFLWTMLPALALGYLIMGLLWPWSVHHRRSIRCTRRNISTRFSKSRGRNCTKAG